MTSPAIENRTLLYATSVLVVFAAVAFGIAVAFAIPDDVAYHSQLTGLAVLGGVGLGADGMLRIEEDKGVISRRLQSFRS